MNWSYSERNIIEPSFHCFYLSTVECVSCKKIPLGAILFLKYWNILTHFLENCKPFMLLLRKLKFNWLRTDFFDRICIFESFYFAVTTFIRDNKRFYKKLNLLIEYIFVLMKIKVVSPFWWDFEKLKGATKL